jgi:3-deoxy-7-phosphoheptulonate synthase
MELIDTNIEQISELSTPNQIIKKLDSQTLENIKNYRKDIENVLNNKDNRLVVIVGPCSIHSISVALDYANFIVSIKEKYKKSLIIIMRTYLAKPRTTIGWKGLIYDPDLNNTNDLNLGIIKSRFILEEISKKGVACSMEHLDNFTPQYFDDLLSWSSIGARSVESQIHRELSSGVSCPVGMKNTTSGDITIAAQAVISASKPHVFLGCNKDGKMSKVKTKGNKNCHIILRGGANGPNYLEKDILETEQILSNLQIKDKIMIDCSHANSNKDYKQQINVVSSVAKQISQGNKSIFGVMIESNINEGKQEISDNLEYGVSITDSCVNLETTIQMLDILSLCVSKKRKFEEI